MAFDGVLPPESLSLAGQAAISRPLACQSTPEPVPGPISLSGTAGPAACGEARMVGSISGRKSVRANRPDRATKSQGNLFFSGGHNGGQDTLYKSISPFYKIRYITDRYSPQGLIQRDGSDPLKGRGGGCENPPHAMPAPRPQKGGSLPSASEISERAWPVRPGRHRPKRTRKIGENGIVNPGGAFL